jgi:uncharacterized protein YjbI with pentapeptide repeats
MTDSEDENEPPGNQQHLAWLLEGVPYWNARRAARDFTPEFGDVDIRQAFTDNGKLNLDNQFKLRGANLKGANLYWADLGGADLVGANFDGTNLQDANLMVANLENASLRGAILDGAILVDAQLNGTKLKGAILVDTDLTETYFINADLSVRPKSS